MAREIPYIQALGEAVHGEMARDDSVIYFGQNLGLTDEDPYIQAFGKDRVRVTPISETAEIGMAVGAAFAGFRPVVQLGELGDGRVGVDLGLGARGSAYGRRRHDRQRDDGEQGQ